MRTVIHFLADIFPDMKYSLPELKALRDEATTIYHSKDENHDCCKVAKNTFSILDQLITMMKERETLRERMSRELWHEESCPAHCFHMQKEEDCNCVFSAAIDLLDNPKE